MMMSIYFIILMDNHYSPLFLHYLTQQIKKRRKKDSVWLNSGVNDSNGMSYYTVNMKDCGEIDVEYQGVHNGHAVVPGAHGISPGSAREIDKMLGSN